MDWEREWLKEPNVTDVSLTTSGVQMGTSELQLHSSVSKFPYYTLTTSLLINNQLCLTRTEILMTQGYHITAAFISVILIMFLELLKFPWHVCPRPYHVVIVCHFHCSVSHNSRTTIWAPCDEWALFCARVHHNHYAGIESRVYWFSRWILLLSVSRVSSLRHL